MNVCCRNRFKWKWTLGTDPPSWGLLGQGTLLYSYFVHIQRWVTHYSRFTLNVRVWKLLLVVPNLLNLYMFFRPVLFILNTGFTSNGTCRLDSNPSLGWNRWNLRVDQGYYWSLADSSSGLGRRIRPDSTRMRKRETRNWDPSISLFIEHPNNIGVRSPIHSVLFRYDNLILTHL